MNTLLEIKLILFVLFQNVLCQDSSCISKETCSECIQELGCVWCISPKNNQTSIRCMEEMSALASDWCDESLLIMPNLVSTIKEDRPFNDGKDETVQIKPQRIKLSLRKGEAFQINFQYVQAKNYPVDLYYVMDLSFSMKKHQDRLGSLGLKLADTMKNITENFQLGFGSFVDKFALPFANTKKPVIPSFKNHMSLSSDYKKFSTEVKMSRLRGNIDSPEGGFDALMQAIVCKSEIGWRPQARHLLVFSTDALYHVAGDGKLIGILTPNDGKCHLKNGTYEKSSSLDYPSVSHINYVAMENNVNIIFAIPKNDYLVQYEMLSKSIENSNMGALDEKSENVLKLILENYNRIVDSVTMVYNTTNDVELKISPSCAFPKENGCTNIHVGEMINFTAVITPRQCLKDDSNRKIISIKPSGLEESLIIELEVLCQCDCSSKSNNQTNAEECSNEGSLECGICQCNEGRFGEVCECSSLSGDNKNSTSCQVTPESEICSGLGTCKCGKCECYKRSSPNEKIYGKYCQYNNYSCKRHGGILCSGRGTCDSGTCTCNAGWSGDSCQCPEATGSCTNPVNNEVCSGHGKCVCGKCECFEDDEMYSGEFCQECRSCPPQRCDELADCVECQSYGKGKYDKNDCLLRCSSVHTTKINTVETSIGERKACRVPDAARCIMLFDYVYTEDKEFFVRAYTEKICSKPLNLIVWISAVIGTIILAGIIMLIIWKIVTTIHDNREYAKFENERKGSIWNTGNPLYKPSTSNFSNPAYRRSRTNSFKFGRK